VFANVIKHNFVISSFHFFFLLGKLDWLKLTAQNNQGNAVITTDYLPFVKVRCLAGKTQCRKGSRNSSQNRTKNKKRKSVFG